MRQVARELMPLNSSIEFAGEKKQTIISFHGSLQIGRQSSNEGLRLLHGLATNLATSLHTPQEA